MTPLQPMHREEVGAVVRKPMTAARKRRIHTLRDGLCGECSQPVPMFGPGVIYDHRFILWITRDDSDEAIWPIHAACDAKKTPGDISKVAKVKRLIRDADPETRKRSKRPLRGRGFSKTKTKRFDNSVVDRKPRNGILQMEAIDNV